MLLVNLGEDRAKVARIVKARGYTAPVVLDVDGSAAQAYGVRVTPTAVLINRDLDIVARARGSRPWTEPAGRALLGALLAQPTR